MFMLMPNLSASATQPLDRADSMLTGAMSGLCRSGVATLKDIAEQVSLVVLVDGVNIVE